MKFSFEKKTLQEDLKSADRIITNLEFVMLVPPCERISCFNLVLLGRIFFLPLNFFRNAANIRT